MSKIQELIVAAERARRVIRAKVQELGWKWSECTEAPLTCFICLRDFTEMADILSELDEALIGFTVPDAAEHTRD